MVRGVCKLLQAYSMTVLWYTHPQVREARLGAIPGSSFATDDQAVKWHSGPAHVYLSGQAAK